MSSPCTAKRVTMSAWKKSWSTRHHRAEQLAFGDIQRHICFVAVRTLPIAQGEPLGNNTAGKSISAISGEFLAPSAKINLFGQLACPGDAETPV